MFRKIVQGILSTLLCSALSMTTVFAIEPTEDGNTSSPSAAKTTSIMGVISDIDTESSTIRVSYANQNGILFNQDFTYANGKVSNTTSGHTTSYDIAVYGSDSLDAHASSNEYLTGSTAVSGGAYDGDPSWNSTYYPNGQTYTGQCVWFAKGKMSDIYGELIAVHGDGWQCVSYLCSEYSDMFYQSATPVAGALFSWKDGSYGHVGVVTAVDSDGTIHIQDGNIDVSSAGSFSWGAAYGNVSGTIYNMPSSLYAGVTFHPFWRRATYPSLASWKGSVSSLTFACPR